MKEKLSALRVKAASRAFSIHEEEDFKTALSDVKGVVSAMIGATAASREIQPNESRQNLILLTLLLSSCLPNWGIPQ